MIGAGTIPRRIKGHKLTLTWSGERGREASSTGTCVCGWEESCSSQREVRHEYRSHLRRMHGEQIARELPRYRGSVVNGYDDSGGLQFSRALNSQTDHDAAVQGAWVTPYVARVVTEWSC